MKLQFRSQIKGRRNLIAKTRWSVPINAKESLVKLEHSPWTNRRRIWLNGDLIIDTKVNGFIDYGSFHELKINEVTCHVVIKPDSNNMSNEGYSYVFFVNGRSLDGKSDIESEIVRNEEKKNHIRTLLY